MAEFPTRYPLSPSHWGAGTGIRTHSIVTVYPAYTFRSDTTAPLGQPLFCFLLLEGTMGSRWELRHLAGSPGGGGVFRLCHTLVRVNTV